ncbi:MAG: hypothetical protein ACM3UL_00805 [Ignavibacteria bacterium]
MSLSSEKSFGHRANKWLFAFIKFNIVGFIVFLVATAIYGLAFGTFGAWTWLVASAVGGVLQFSLISYLNKTRIGKIFDSCEQRKNNIQETIQSEP